MNPEAKKAWIEALRSGRYKQGTGKLRSLNDEFCCLGVLCDLGKRRDTEWRGASGIGCYTYGDTGEYGVLPSHVAYAAEVPMEFQQTLYGMNDGHGQHPRTFTEIADWIEANL